MVNVLVSLIGDQSAPNLFLIQDRSFQHIDQHLFITTHMMEKRNRVDHLVQALGLSSSQYQKVIVHADNLLDIRNQLDHLKLSKASTQYYVNITSGTKIMSIGAFDFFSQPAFNAKIYYVPVRQIHFCQIFPLTEYQEYEFHPSTTIQHYLTSYGLKIISEPFSMSIRSKGYTQKLFNYFIEPDTGAYFKKQVHLIRALYNQANKKKKISDTRDPIAIENNAEIKAFLNTIDFPLEHPHQLLPFEAQYLIGGWFELYIHNLLLEFLPIQKWEITLQTKIIGEDSSSMAATSEFDVMFLYQRKLYILECKTGIPEQYPKIHKYLDPMLYRLAALRKTFGMNVQVALVTLSNKLRRKGKIHPSIANRSNDLETLLIDGDLLMQSPETWIRELVELP